jgi:hypothetical protein
MLTEREIALVKSSTRWLTLARTLGRAGRLALGSTRPEGAAGSRICLLPADRPG